MCPCLTASLQTTPARPLLQSLTRMFSGLESVQHTQAQAHNLPARIKALCLLPLCMCLCPYVHVRVPQQTSMHDVDAVQVLKTPCYVQQYKRERPGLQGYTHTNTQTHRLSNHACLAKAQADMTAWRLPPAPGTPGERCHLVALGLRRLHRAPGSTKHVCTYNCVQQHAQNTSVGLQEEPRHIPVSGRACMSQYTVVCCPQSVALMLCQSWLAQHASARTNTFAPT